MYSYITVTIFYDFYETDIQGHCNIRVKKDTCLNKYCCGLSYIGCHNDKYALLKMYDKKYSSSI